jgi:predicted secreted protein
MKRAMASVALLVFAGCLADCGKSAADQMAEQKMKAINETCEQEATDLTDKQTAEDWKVLVDGMRKGGDNKYSTSDAQKAYHRQAKDECIKRKLAGTQ